MVGRRLAVSFTIAASVAAGGLAGAFLGVPGLSGASTSAPQAALQHAGGRAGPSAAFDAAAQALGITTDELRQRLSDGTTSIADIAREKNVDVNTVIDEIAKADRQSIEDFVNNPRRERGHGPGFGPGRGPGFGKPFGLDEKFDAAAKALGITVDDLRAAWRDGKSLADVAREKGVDVNKVIDAMVGAAETRIDQAQTDGKITAEQAERFKAGLRERITDLVNGEGRGGPWGGPGHRGP